MLLAWLHAAASTETMNVGTQLSAEYTEQKAFNRKCLLAIVSNFRFLARQGLWLYVERIMMLI